MYEASFRDVLEHIDTDSIVDEKIPVRKTESIVSRAQ